jgi:hypothetical protein
MRVKYRLTTKISHDPPKVSLFGIFDPTKKAPNFLEALSLLLWALLGSNQ